MPDPTIPDDAAVILELDDAAIAGLREHRLFLEYSGPPRLAPGDCLVFRRNVRVEPYAAILGGTVLPNIGAFSYTWSNVPMGMTIGRYCSIAGNLVIPGPRHLVEAITTSSVLTDPAIGTVHAALADRGLESYPWLPPGKFEEGPVVGHDVWVGLNAMIMPGVTVGTGSVVAAGAVVVKDVPPYSIVGGNPARVLKQRFDDRIVERLLASEWWRYHFLDLPSSPWDQVEQWLDELDGLLAAGTLQPYEPEPVPLPWTAPLTSGLPPTRGVVHRVEEIAARGEQIAARVEQIAARGEQIAGRLEAVASIGASVASRTESIAARVEAVAVDAAKGTGAGGKRLLGRRP